MNFYTFITKDQIDPTYPEIWWALYSIPLPIITNTTTKIGENGQKLLTKQAQNLCIIAWIKQIQTELNIFKQIQIMMNRIKQKEKIQTDSNTVNLG